MSNISLDELRKTTLKQSFLLDKMMSVCINAGVAVNCFSEHECRMLLKDIYYAWCEVREEYTPISEIIDELWYECTVKSRRRVKNED